MSAMHRPGEPVMKTGTYRNAVGREVFLVTEFDTFPVSPSGTGWTFVTPTLPRQPLITDAEITEITEHFDALLECLDDLVIALGSDVAQRRRVVQLAALRRTVTQDFARLLLVAHATTKGTQ